MLIFQYNLLPRGILSLKVLQELPLIVVLMYQIYKNAVHSEVAEFIPLILTTINLQPTLIQRYVNKITLTKCYSQKLKYSTS